MTATKPKQREEKKKNSYEKDEFYRACRRATCNYILWFVYIASVLKTYKSCVYVFSISFFTTKRIGLFLVISYD